MAPSVLRWPKPWLKALYIDGANVRPHSADSERDETIAESLGLRPDLPAETLQELLSNASETVRTRLLQAAPTGLKERIQA